MKKTLLIWFVSQLVFYFTAIFLLVNGRSDIAGEMFGVFIYQFIPFVLFVLYYFIKSNLKQKAQ